MTCCTSNVQSKLCDGFCNHGKRSFWLKHSTHRASRQGEMLLYSRALTVVGALEEPVVVVVLVGQGLTGSLSQMEGDTGG